MNQKSIAQSLSALLFAALLAPFSANATVLNFEDLGGNNNVVNFPANYNGFDFLGNGVNLDIVDVTNPSSPWGSHGPAHSGQNIVLNDWSNNGVIASLSGAFTYNGAWFKEWSGTNNALTVNGYLNNVLVDSANFSISQQWQFVGGFNGLVDRVEIVDNGTIFMMDDFTYNNAAVPEPGTIALLGLGLAGIGLRRRAKR